MINNDVLIKYVRSRISGTDWPKYVRSMILRLSEMKLGFPGIGNPHLSLSTIDNISVGDIFIYDPYLLSLCPRGSEAPVMLRFLGGGKYYIEGIGNGSDIDLDPDRILRRWKDTVILYFEPGTLILDVTVRPTSNGGPGYYYFFKSYRDNRD